MRSDLISLIPEPSAVKRLIGTFVLDEDVCLSADSLFRTEASLFLDQVHQSTGLIVGPEKVGGKRIAVSMDKTIAPSAYQMEVRPEKITLRAGDGAGAFYALQTLLQLLPPAILGKGPRSHITWSIPCCAIEDKPRFSWRGMMLDSARHFQPVEWIKKFIDLLAQHKFNILHWHLTDHQGWRVEILKYPRLTEIGAWRNGTVRGHYFANGGEDSVPYGGYYQQSQIRELVAYAAARHITIVPEIEMPGHCQAALAAYPELACPPATFEVARRWGGTPAVFNPNESTIQFLCNVLEEIAGLFPGPYIHIGGDEADCSHWNSSEEVQQRMRELGVRDEKELHSWFIKRIGTFVASHNRQLVGWDEIADGNLPAGAVIMAWRSPDRGFSAMERGHQVVMAPYQSTYFDYYQSPDIQNEPLGNVNIDVNHLDLKTVYAFDPHSQIPDWSLQQQILGVQGQLWTEYMAEPAQIEYMAFPRACALAEVAWSETSGREWPGFLERLRHHTKRLACQSIRFRSFQEISEAHLDTEGSRHAVPFDDRRPRPITSATNALGARRNSAIF